MAKKKTFENIISNLLGEPVSNLCHAFYDQYVEANVKFRSRAGMKTLIIRRQLGKCCKWCADLAGIYTPENAPDDIYKRHDNCKCMVTYKDEDGYTDVWSKKEFESQKEAREEKEIELLTNTELGRLKRLQLLAEEDDKLRDLLRSVITIGRPECDLEYVFSKEFSTKFSRLTSNSKINDSIRRQAQAILLNCNGTYTETLAVFNSRTGEMLLKQRGRKNALEIEITDSQKRIIFKNRGITIALHNHPTNLFPTGSDFVTAAQRRYSFGIVVTHNGRVIKYTAPTEPATARMMDKVIDRCLREAYTDDEKILKYIEALKELEKDFGITWQEL